MTSLASGIISYGAYVPYRRLARGLIGGALGSPGGGGTRSVSSYDEDTTSMGVEAGRRAMAGVPDAQPVDRILFTTSNPAYIYKTNATTLHAALGLAPHAGAYDFGGAVRSAIGALRAAADGAAAGQRILAVAADTHNGLPGSPDEVDGGDAGAAFVFGPGPALAELIATSSASEELLDRWRAPGENRIRRWEPRFAEDVLVTLAGEAAGEALKGADLSPGDVDRLIVCGAHERAVKRIRNSLGVPPTAIVDDLSATVGNPAAAQPGLLLADVLDRAQPNEVLMLVSVADGADVLILRTTEALADLSPTDPVEKQIASGSEDLSYAQFLTWRGYLVREPPNRPDPSRPAAPPSLRDGSWKFGLAGARCNACGTMHLPPDRVCLECHAVDDMSSESLSDRRATLVTFTIDRLAFSMSPPTVLAVVDFDGGGRLQCELADVDPGEVAVGQRVEMTFRRLYTADGVHNYFWKAKPVRG